MINLSKYIADKNISLLEASKFFVNNDWFGVCPLPADDGLYLEDDDFNAIKGKLDLFCLYNSKSEKEKANLLLENMQNDFPSTHKIIIRFFREYNCSNKIKYILLDFLLFNLPGELTTCTDFEIETIVKTACEDLAKAYGMILCSFFNWTKDKYKTIYRNIYRINYGSSKNNDAYDDDEYLTIMYHLFNEEYISKNDMYSKAANSKNYIDTWIFLSLHFTCMLRKSDILLLPHPKLTMAPNKVLDSIKTNAFSEEDARATIYSIIYSLKFNPRKPNKTKRFNNVPDIKFPVPESLEVHYGKLFAIAEAHYQINNCEGNLIRDMHKYDQISRYMGNEIGELFLYSDFKTRAANKYNMQTMQLIADNATDKDTCKINGYLLAELARSHKGTYGEFSKTTAVYLKDGKANRLTPEFVQKELHERGTLSYIVSLLLNTLTNGQYSLLPFPEQTELYKAANLKPNDVEKITEVTKNMIDKVSNIYNQLMAEKISVIDFLHTIANKNCYSKDGLGLCLKLYCYEQCPFPNRKTCINCEYEIATKFTLIISICNYKKLLSDYETTNDPLEKKKSKSLAIDYTLAKLEEMLTIMEKEYGKESVIALNKMLEVI